MTTTLQPRRARDDGSLPFALPVTGVVLAISTFLMSLVAWQVKSQTTTANNQDARWAAISAINLGMQRLATVASPSDLAQQADIPITTSDTTVPVTAEWLATPARGVRLHWWVQTTSDPAIINLYGEGKAGFKDPVITSLVLTVRYDYAVHAWIMSSTVRPWEPDISEGD